MDTDRAFDLRFRPLLSATIGSGVVALATLDFTASGWESFGTEGRVLIAVAARCAFFVFLMNSLVLLGAYLVTRIAGPFATFCLNLFGAATFLGGTFLIGGLLSSALDLESPGAAEPPAAVQAFLGLAGVGLIFLLVILVAAAAARLFDRRPVDPKSNEGTNDA